MGQYYRAMTRQANKRFVVYNRDVITDGEKQYTPAKLTEHSWWLNPFVNAVAKTLYYEPKHVVWLGDYAQDFMADYPDGFNGITRARVQYWDKICWGEPDKGVAVAGTDFSLDGKFVVNLTKKHYFDCDTYFRNSVMRDNTYDGWCLHPLPLLTCIGNRCGCGDYNYPSYDSTYDLVSTWAFDEICVADKPPADCMEVFPLFKEKSRED